MRIYLIGFMGAGKSSLGAHVATRLDAIFVDTDQFIEQKASLSIPEIFSIKGEDSFRKYEAETLRETVQFDQALIACGGGLPVYHHNMDWMLEHGVTMYLELPEEILLASLVQHRSMRPLLSALSEEEAIQKAISLLQERRPVYELAAMTISMTGDFERDAILLEKACSYIW